MIARVRLAASRSSRPREADGSPTRLRVQERRIAGSGNSDAISSGNSVAPDSGAPQHGNLGRSTAVSDECVVRASRSDRVRGCNAHRAPPMTPRSGMALFDREIPAGPRGCLRWGMAAARSAAEALPGPLQRQIRRVHAREPDGQRRVLRRVAPSVVFDQGVLAGKGRRDLRWMFATRPTADAVSADDGACACPPRSR